MSLGNMLTSKSPEGMKSSIVYKADHTLSESVPTIGFTFQGKWETKDGQICGTYDPAIPDRPNPECSPMLPWLQVGQSFKARNGLIVTLAAGTKWRRNLTP